MGEPDLNDRYISFLNDSKCKLKDDGNILEIENGNFAWNEKVADETDDVRVKRLKAEKKLAKETKTAKKISNTASETQNVARVDINATQSVLDSDSLSYSSSKYTNTEISNRIEP